MGIYDELSKLEFENRTSSDDSGRDTGAVHSEENKISSIRKQASKSPIDQSTGRSAEQSTRRSVNQTKGSEALRSSGKSVQSLRDVSPILPRPKSFYITELQDEKIDGIVRQMKRDPRVHHLLASRRLAPLDRSTVIRLYLQSFDPSDDELISRLVDRLLGQLADTDV